MKGLKYKKEDLHDKQHHSFKYLHVICTGQKHINLLNWKIFILTNEYSHTLQKQCHQYNVLTLTNIFYSLMIDHSQKFI